MVQPYDSTADMAALGRCTSWWKRPSDNDLEASQQAIDNLTNNLNSMPIAQRVVVWDKMRTIERQYSRPSFWDIIVLNLSRNSNIQLLHYKAVELDKNIQQTIKKADIRAIEQLINDSPARVVRKTAATFFKFQLIQAIREHNLDKVKLMIKSDKFNPKNESELLVKAIQAATSITPVYNPRTHIDDGTTTQRTNSAWAIVEELVKAGVSNKNLYSAQTFPGFRTAKQNLSLFQIALDANRPSMVRELIRKDATIAPSLVIEDYIWHRMVNDPRIPDNTVVTLLQLTLYNAVHQGQLRGANRELALSVLKSEKEFNLDVVIGLIPTSVLNKIASSLKSLYENLKNPMKEQLRQALLQHNELNPSFRASLEPPLEATLILLELPPIPASSCYIQPTGQARTFCIPASDLVPLISHSTLLQNLKIDKGETIPWPPSVTPYAMKQLINHYKGKAPLSTVFDTSQHRQEVAMAIECLDLDTLTSQRIDKDWLNLTRVPAPGQKQTWGSSLFENGEPKEIASDVEIRVATVTARGHSPILAKASAKIKEMIIKGAKDVQKGEKLQLQLSIPEEKVKVLLKFLYTEDASDLTPADVDWLLEQAKILEFTPDLTNLLEVTKRIGTRMLDSSDFI